MSVLVPGDEPLQRRICLGAREQELEIWFAQVEAWAWAYVNACCDTRPDEIFLVTGQTLTNQYSICHQEQQSLNCEVHIEGDLNVPDVVNTNLLTGFGLTRVSASTGFQTMMDRSGEGRSHSIFLNVSKSKPTTLIHGISRKKRLAQLHR
jgi:hypothetical protein